MRHSLLRNIAVLLQTCTSFLIHHVYREANSVDYWVASLVADHSVNILWTDIGDFPARFWDVILFDLFGCVHAR